jgi:hypothetical protein
VSSRYPERDAKKMKQNPLIPSSLLLKASYRPFINIYMTRSQLHGMPRAPARMGYHQGLASIMV